MYTYMYKYDYISMYVRLCMYICMYVCVYICLLAKMQNNDIVVNLSTNCTITSTFGLMPSGKL